MRRLNKTSLAAVPDGVATPEYDRDACGTGIVHLGLGAFHKAHQAFYTDAALAAGGGDWKIIGVSMRNEQTAQDFNEQDGLYTILVKAPERTEAQIIGSIASALCARTQPDDVLNALSDPATRIVTITVTEKGYGINRATGGVDPSHPVIAQDLKRDQAPVGAVGLIVAALEKRRADGTAPFTVLCCDNLPENGKFVHAGLIDFANRFDTGLGDWIARNVACPSSMVDRITPAQTAATREIAADLTGTQDLLAVETESFHQWVIEDHFPSGRPSWEAAGAIFTRDVAPFEKMKLRLLNGSHSLIAYMGLLLGKQYVRDVLSDAGLEALVRKHLDAASATLPPMHDIDLPAYCADLVERFRNPNIAHETSQIGTDGSEKLPQRILAPAVDALGANQSVRPFAFATALWIWFCRTGDLNDPRAEQLESAAQKTSPEEILADLETISGLIPAELATSVVWRRDILSILSDLMEHSPEFVISSEIGERAN